MKKKTLATKSNKCKKIYEGKNTNIDTIVTNREDKENETIEEDIGIAEEMANRFSPIKIHKWDNGVLAFQLPFDSIPTWIPFRYLCHDAPT